MRRFRNHRYLVTAILALSLWLGTRPGAVRVARAQEGGPVGTFQLARFDRLTTADGLSYPIVQAALQDSQGYMWFATDGGGLNRYDGYTITVFRSDPADPDSLPFDDLAALCEDSEGQLWIGGSGGLLRFDRADGRFVPVDSRGQVNVILEDGKGVLWVGFWHGLYGYDRASGEILFSYQYISRWRDDRVQITQGSVNALYEDRDGALWIGVSGGLDRLDLETGRFSHYRHDPADPASLSHDMVLSILEDKESRLWVGTAGGLNLMDRASGRFTRLRHDPTDPASLAHDSVHAILEDSQGMLWIATLNGLDRLILVEGQNAGLKAEFIHHRHDPFNLQSLGDDLVFSLYEDQAGVLWASTANGLSKYSRRAAQFSRYQQGLAKAQAVSPGEEVLPALEDDLVYVFYEDRDGLLWIGGRESGLYRLDPTSGELAVYRRDPAGPGDNGITAIVEDRAGVLWVGTTSGRVSEFDREAGRFRVKWRIEGTAISALVEDGAGNLWIGTSGQGLYRIDPGRAGLVNYNENWQQPDHWREYGSLSSHIVEALYVDGDGRLWVGTYSGGINIWDGEKNRFSHFRNEPDNPRSLSYDRVKALYESPDSASGVMWVGTDGGGLNRLDRATGEFTRYGEANGLPGGRVACILSDTDGFLWLGTIRGISRFDPWTETTVSYDRRDGVPGLAYTCFQSRSGLMYFGTTKGFYTVHPEQLSSNAHVPPIVITQFSLHNQPQPGGLANGQALRLSYNDNYLAFEFAALDFTIPEKNLYAYKLEGLDEEWIHAGTRRRVEYTNLSPGDYVFRVKGSNNDGVWNEEGVTVAIVIEPPFWETWWFRGAVLLVVAAAAFGGYRLRVRSLEARGRHLEKQVTERTAALVKANEQLGQQMAERIRAEEELARQRAAAAVTAERGRLARELHDAVTQTLFSASLMAEVMPKLWAEDPETGRRHLEDIRLLTRGALAEMRMLLLELRPEALTAAKMGDLLSQLGRAASGRCGVAVSVEADEDGRLPPPVQIALYRIAQEALNNAAKHAKAGHMWVSYYGEMDRARLVIGDNGRGFEVDNIPPDHFGLQIMKERAVSIGAALVLSTRPGEGTNIMVTWPAKGKET